jgi:hypothetical protein
MSYKTILTNLYFLLIHSDGSVNAKEASIGTYMCQHEGIPTKDFDRDLLLLSTDQRDKVYNETIKGMRALKRIQQVKSIAWLCLAANSDGFMDKQEWKFIYKLYCTELKLPLDEVLSAQKELLRAQIHFSTQAPASPARIIL